MASAMAEDPNYQDDQLANLTTEDIFKASCILDNEIRILKEDVQRTNMELESNEEKIKQNQEKIKLNKQLPYLVGNIVEVAKIETKKMLIQMVEIELEKRREASAYKGQFRGQSHFFGVHMWESIVEIHSDA